ncbi:MAG: MerR family DNA-binding transcriptional regulator [Gammaproteobacteria bacterium]|jgi:DNA-binding transcriptional MerR regulator
MPAENGKDRMIARYTIGNLAREFDVTPRAIRFYEDAGLLAPARIGRTRIYGARERVRLKLILRGKRLGFSLSEIREIFHLYDTPSGEVGQLQLVCEKIRVRRAALEQQRHDIDVVLGEMHVLEQHCAHALVQEDTVRAQSS